MSEVKKTSIFSLYEVSPEVLHEFDGESLFDVFCEISSLTKIEARSTVQGGTPDHVVLIPNCSEELGRLQDLKGLFFNLLGIADASEIEATFDLKPPSLRKDRS